MEFRASGKVLHIPSTASEIPASWAWHRLDDLCEGIFDCPHSTPKLTSDGPFVARSQDIRLGVFRLNEAGRVSEETYLERIKRAEPTYGDLLYSREGTYFGIAAEVPRNAKVCLGQRMVLIRPDPQYINFRFLRYWLNSPVLTAHIYGHRDGTVAERLNLPTIRGLPVPRAPLDEQKAIAHILGTLDDKIELNQQMNWTLEAIARALFKSWFIDFDPVRAKLDGRQPTGMDADTAALFPAEFEDSVLGKVPKDWKVQALSGLAEISSGKRPSERSSELTTDMSIPLFGGGGVMAYVKAPLYQEPILLTGRVGTLGLVFRISSPCWASDNTLVIIPKKIWDYEFLYFQLKEIRFESLNRGSTQPLVTQGDLKEQKFVVPHSSLLQKFHKRVSLLYKRLDANIVETESLTSIRDALLPKLLSGEIRVKNAEKVVEVVA